MGLWEKMTGLDRIPEPFEKVVEERSYHSVADPQTAFLLGYHVPGTPVVSEHSAMNLSGVFRAVSLIAGSIAGLPMKTMQMGEKNQAEVINSFLDSPGAATAMDGVRLTAFEWKELVALHIALHGDCFLQHIRNGADAVVALYPIHPLSVEVKWDNARYGGKLFKIHQADGTAIEMDARDMTHIMGLSYDGLRGISPISAARMSIGTAISGDKAANRQFTNGAMVSGIITPGVDEDLSPDDARVIKDSVNRVMSGPDNAGDIPVINRRLNFTPWTLSAQDAQFIESRSFSIDEIGRWFGVPPHLLGLTEKSTSWGQGIAEQNRGLSRYTLSNYTGRIQERLSTILSPGKWVEFDYSAFIKPSPEDEIKLLIEQMNSGLLTQNEARGYRNLPPVDGGDVPRLPPGSLTKDQMSGSSGQSNQPPPEGV